MKSRWVLFCIILLFANLVHAEGACPPGQYPIGGQGAIACAPIPQEAPIQQAPRPSGEWIKTWGAISIGSVDSTTIYGVTTGKLSKSEAEDDSLKRCSSQGEINCKIVFTYHNQCAAIAEPHINGKPFDAGIVKFVGAGTIAEASNLVAKNCQERNKGIPEAKCEVVYTACSDPIIQKY